jgi:CRP-like cAMP-binding protein
MIEPLLAKLELRDPLHPQEREALAASFAAPRSCAAGEVLVAQGSSPDESTLLLSGMTGRVTMVRDGRQQITALHIAGDFVDLHSLLIRRMDHSIIALSSCRVTTVAHARLRTLTSQFPHLARLLWLSTLLDSAIHRQWLVAMGRLDALAHMAHLLCELSLRLRVIGLTEGDHFELPLSQATFADALGMSPVHVNRTLQELRGRKLVAWKGKRVTITDWAALAELAEFDPTYLQLEPTPV